VKEIGKEFIEIGGVEYTLFLNRKGIIAWEKYASEEKKVVEKLSAEFEKAQAAGVIKEDTNPFEDLDIVDKLEGKNESVTKYYQKLYWIMLYDKHKLSFEKVKELYTKACEEYGEEQIIQLGTQMVEDANENLMSEAQKTELKNLKALRPTK